MGFLDELKKLTKPYADDDEDDYDDYDDEPVEEEEPAPAPRTTRRSVTDWTPGVPRAAGLSISIRRPNCRWCWSSRSGLTTCLKLRTIFGTSILCF